MGGSIASKRFNWYPKNDRFKETKINEQMFVFVLAKTLKMEYTKPYP